MYKSCFVSIVGKPNAGKSTLLNTLIGEKVSIVSWRPQTTRNIITGILHGEDYQIVFLDTPGIQHGKNLLGEYMAKSVRSASDGADAILYVVDGAKRIDEDEYRNIERTAASSKISLVVAVNKTDEADRELLVKNLLRFNEMIAATKNDEKTEKIIDVISEKAEEKSEKTGETAVGKLNVKAVNAEKINEIVSEKTDAEIEKTESVVSGKTDGKNGETEDIISEKTNEKDVETENVISEKNDAKAGYKNENVAGKKDAEAGNAEKKNKIISDKSNGKIEKTDGKIVAVVPVSALKGGNVDALKNELKKFLKEGEPYYSEDMITDKNLRFLAQEIIREKTLLYLEKEIPHGIGVNITNYTVRGDGEIADIEAEIVAAKQSHKPIIIGKGGAMLKKIASAARRDIEKISGEKVFLKVWVKVIEDWQDNYSYLKELGYDKKDI
jgi:GTP-binding protein Era